jgi:hypothetical protein
MRQHLVVMRDRHAIEPHPELLRDRTTTLARRQLPQPAEQTLGPAACKQHFARVLAPQRLAREHGQLVLLLARRDDRQLVLTPCALRLAPRRERAHEAARRDRRAHRCAELHEALVQVTGRDIAGERRHQLSGALPQQLRAARRLDVLGQREHAREHSRDIAVDERGSFAVRDRCDRTRGIRPDAGHRAQLRRARRQPPGESLRHLARTRVKVACARVVAEPGPRSEHVVEWCLRERRHRREPRHPALPVRDHRLHACLLQHDLADPDRIWVARAPPRQVAAHDRVVRDGRARDGSGVHPANVSVVEVNHQRHGRIEDRAERGVRCRDRRRRGVATLLRVADQRIRRRER